MLTGERAWEGLLTITLQSGLICLPVGVGLLLLRKSAAASRHLLLTLAMGALLAAPLLSLYVPPLQIPWRWPGAPPRPVERRSTPPEVVSGSGGVAGVGALSRSAGARMPLIPSEPISAQPLVSESLGVSPSTAVPEARPYRVPYRQALTARQLLLGIWLLGAGIGMLRLVAGLLGAWRVTARETAVNPDLVQRVGEVQRETGMRRHAGVRQIMAGSPLPAPLTWGLFQPTLLLPANFSEWSPERQRMVLLHELAHVQRGDCLIQALLQLTRALYWFHPLVWWITARLQAESERACDDTVLLTGVTPSAYAETLLEVIRTMNRSKSKMSLLSMLGMAHPPIEARLRAILSPQRRQRPSRTMVLGATCGMAGCALALASVQVGARPRQSPLQPASPSAPGSVAQASSDRRNREMEEQRLRLVALEAELNAKTRKAQAQAEAAMLRRKLEVLEQLLVRNQQENAQLRQQLQSLMIQNHKAADTNKGMSLKARREAELAQGDARRSQEAALSGMVDDLKQQQALLTKRAQQAEELYRNGLAASDETTKAKVQLLQAQLRLQAAQEQLRAAQAGRKVSAQEQTVTQLRLHLSEQYGALSQAQAKLAQVKIRHDAGIASAQELAEAETQISTIKVEIDKIKVQLSVQP